MRCVAMMHVANMSDCGLPTPVAEAWAGHYSPLAGLLEAFCWTLGSSSHGYEPDISYL